MKLDSRYRIDRILTEDSNRAVLDHVLIRKWGLQDVAVVSDGCTLVVVPVGLDEVDRPGLIHVSVIKHAAALAGWDDVLDLDEWRAMQPATMQIGHRFARLADGSLYPRSQPRYLEASKYPNIEKVVPNLASERPDNTFSIQPALLARTAEALGCRIVAVHLANDKQAIVWPADPPRPNGDALVPPFAVMMLCKPDLRPHPVEITRS